MGASPLFRRVDAALLRATTAPPGPRRPADRSVVDGDVDTLVAWTGATWAETGLAAAVGEASPDLARQVRRVIDGRTKDLRRLRRMALALARYDARWRGRATPFGLFAGVAPVRVADRAEVQWSGRHRCRRTADGSWLAALARRLESDAVLRRRLAVVRSDLAVACGDRLVVPVPVGRGARPASVSVRLTPLVGRVLEVAGSPIEVGRLADEVAGAGLAGAVEDVVGVLLAHGALVSCLTPPSTVVDGAAWLLERLRSLPADAVAGVEPLVAEIAAVVSGPPAAPGSMLPEVDRTSPVWRTDVRLGCAVALPDAVVDEAAAAVEALLRWSPAPSGYPGWLRFHARFLDRYGSGAVVALLDVLDPVTGVGLPEHLAVEGPEVEPGERPMTPRDRVLLRLAQQAALDGVRQVVLDDQQCGEPVVPAGEPVAPPHVDVCFDVRTGSTAQLDDGEFLIGVSSVGPGAVATVGRFLAVVDAPDRDRMIAEFGRLPVAVAGARPVQVSFPALRLPARTAATAPQVLEQVVGVGEHSRGGALTVHDLAVTADHRRLYLVSRRDGRVVETVAVNALARHATPVLARVLLELPRARTARITGWDWGAAACLPFRPSVRKGRAVLAPATWTLPPADPLTATAARPGRAEVDRLRERHRWPRFVHVGHGDRQLRLDIDNATDVDLLREHLGRGVGPVTVTEAPSPADHGWLDGRAHEVVVPLATTAAPVGAPTALIGRPCFVIRRDHGDLPGAEGDTVLSARLSCRPEAVDTIVVEHLSALLDRFEVAPRWWFLRHRTPAAFLRLRLHVPRYGEAAERVGEWAAELRRQGLSGDLVLDTYRPELARYGASAQARAAVERVFAADSAAARAQLALTARQRRVDPVALTAASMIDLVTAARGGQAGLGWLVERADLATGSGRTDRAQLAQVLDLLDPATPHREVARSWRDRAETVRHYADLSLPAQPLADTVLVSLLHLHHVRALGVDAVGEGRCHRLARAAALSLRARPSRAVLVPSCSETG